MSNPTGPCKPPLTAIAGTGLNIVQVPSVPGSGYTSITNELLYEIWQTNLLIIAALNPPGVVTLIDFTIGDGKAGTPANGTTSFHVAALADKTFLVLRNGIALGFYDGVTHLQIIRFNDHVNGGFDFDPASGLTFATGEWYQIYPIGINTTIAP